MTADLHYKKIGQGPALVILHGLFGSLDNWMSIAKRLSDTRSVYLVDLRNHGLSFHHPRFDYPAMAEDLQRLSDRLGLREYELMGHSMGGKVAMFHAREHTDKILRLMVIDIGPKKYPVHHHDILQGLHSIDPGQIQSRAQGDEILSKHIPEPGVRQFLLKNLQRVNDGTFRWKMNLEVISNQIELIGAPLPNDTMVETPSLFLRGGVSNYITDEDFDQIYRHFPSATVDTIPGAGHWIHAEAPDLFVERIRDFMKV